MSYQCETNNFMELSGLVYFLRTEWLADWKHVQEILLDVFYHGQYIEHDANGDGSYEWSVTKSKTHNGETYYIVETKGNYYD